MTKQMSIALLRMSTARATALSTALLLRKKVLNQFFQAIKSAFKLENIPALFLVSLALLLGVINFKSGTYLSGWDTLHPEFNFGLSFERLLWGVFRSEQGVGAVAAHSHIADLPRVFLLFIASFFLPESLLRYLYISLCLVVGVLGCFVFIKDILLKNLSLKVASPLAMLGGMYYLFNLGTLQHFSVPFEMFTTQYALLPWLFWGAANYIKKGSIKSLTIFSLLTLLSTPMAFASVLWFGYFFALVGFLLAFAKKDLKRSLIVIISTLIINSFWLLPAAYFIVSGNASFVPEARINKIFSEEAFTYNKSYGNLVDAVIFKNFLLDWPVYQGNGEFDYLLDATRSHLTRPGVLAIGYVSAFVVLIGFFKSFRDRYTRSLILPAIIALAFIINQNPPLDAVFGFIRESIPLFKEALRFPFTKFSIILMFTFACFFSLGSLSLYNLWRKISKNRFSTTFLFVYATIFSLLLMLYMGPFFNKQLISPYMQVNIPQEYFEMFDWFNNQPRDKRVAFLPIHSFWGWTYYSWGFQGAQFTSFGIRQPILDRDYDRWNPSNEQYYREMSYAVYSQDPNLLEKVLEKYRVRFLVIDENILSPNPDQDKKVLFLTEIKLLLSSTKKVKLAKNFNDKILVYRVDLEKDGEAFITSPKKIVAIENSQRPLNIDWGYIDYGDYVSDVFPSRDTLGSDILRVYYPFRSLTDNQSITNKDLVSLEKDSLKLSMRNLPSKSVLSISSYLENEKLLPADLYARKTADGIELKFNFRVFQLTLDQPPVSLDYLLPYKQSVNNPELLINIDDLQTLKLRYLRSEEFTYQGSVFLRRSYFNNLALYEVDPRTTPKLVNHSQLQQLIFDQGVQVCSAPEEDQVFGVDTLPSDGFKLIGKNVQACFRIPLSTLLDKEEEYPFKSLFSLNFKSNSETQNFGHYCIFDKTLNRCIKEQNQIYPGTQTIDYLPMAREDINKLDLVFFINNYTQDSEQINYSDINYLIVKPIYLLTISPDDIDQKLVNQNLEIDPQTNLILKYSDQINSGESTIPLIQRRKIRYCGNLLPFEYDSRYDQNGEFIEYSSKHGSACDYFSMPSLSHGTGYLLNVEYQNVSGLPLRLCIANNYSKRCDLYLALPKSPEFTTYTLLIPPINDGGAGYNIHIDNYSVGNIKSINRIKNLKILALPYQGLTRLNFISTKASNIPSNVDIVSSKQLLPHLFFVNYANKNNNTGVISLNQAYEKGWVMLGSGKHVMVNGWANGWLIKKGDSGSVFIFYMPDILEIIGFIGIELMFFYLLKRITY